jgi:hypothetical protein
MRPDDIPQDVWDDAARALYATGTHDLPSPSMEQDIQVIAAVAILAERERWQPAVTYFQHYCQDEAEDVENCVCGQEQHIAAKNFRDAIRNPVQPADPSRGDNISPTPLGASNDDFATIPHLGPVA